MKRSTPRKRGGGQVEMSYDELSECLAGKGRVDENLEKMNCHVLFQNFETKR